MKKLVILLFVCLAMTAANAQKHKKFDPAGFEADLEQFIATDACLTPEESAKFFPLYREMRKKQMAYFNADRRYRHVDFSDDKACAEAIRNHDRNDIEMKEIQQEYHEKFMRLLPASKVFKIIISEDKFHRQVFKHAAGKQGKR